MSRADDTRMAIFLIIGAIVAQFGISVLYILKAEQLKEQLQECQGVEREP